MPVTHFWDFTRDNGLPVTVEYLNPGSGPVEIVSAWPDTPAHHVLARWRVWSFGRRTWTARASYVVSAGFLRLDEWWRASLTADEAERFCAHIAEHDQRDYA